jgi:hypothetical protein
MEFVKFPPLIIIIESLVKKTLSASAQNKNLSTSSQKNGTSFFIITK